MSRYIQRGKVCSDELDYAYMGSAEFEFGSVQLTRQLLRFGQVTSKILDEVYYRDPKQEAGVVSVEKLVIIANTYDTPHGNCMDRAVRDFHVSVMNSYTRDRNSPFKEPTRLEYSVGMVGAETYKPVPQTGRVMYDCDFWLGVDFGVTAHITPKAFDEVDAAENLKRYQRYLTDENAKPVWVVCRLKHFKLVTQAMSFPKLHAPGCSAVPVESLRLFDRVRYRTDTGEFMGKVVGIYEKGVQVERGGQRYMISDDAVIKIVKESERA